MQCKFSIQKGLNIIIKKEEILDAAIDLFAEYGVMDVCVKKIAIKSNVSRSNVYYHFKKGKDEIIENIFNMFSELLLKNVKTIMERMNANIDADSIVTSLFLIFDEEDSIKGRKICKIIFADHAYNKKIGDFLLEMFFKKREARYCQIFDMLIINGKVKPFDSEAAARMLCKMFVAFALEDTFLYPFECKKAPPHYEYLRKDCLHIINHILNGTF